MPRAEVLVPERDAPTTLVSEGGERTVNGRKWHHREGAVVAGRYRLVEPIGFGGAGEVWLAEHMLLNTKVAVKFCLGPSSVDAERARTALDRFRFEAQVSAQLCCKTRHIVVVHDAGKDATGPFVVMEYAPGRGLDDRLRREGPLAVETVARIIEHIADALSVAHASGIVHRDLKPANILMVPDDEAGETAKLADFGIAKAATHRTPALSVDAPRETGHGIVVGTPDYLSPERARGFAVDEGADLWALAVVTYEALTGVSPFRRKSSGPSMLAILTSDYQPVSKRRAGLPPALDGWFRRAFDQEAPRRFTTAREMSDALSRILVGRKRRRSPRRSPPASIVALMTGGVILGALTLPGRLPTKDALGAPNAPITHAEASATSEARADRLEEGDERARAPEATQATAVERLARAAVAHLTGQCGVADPKSERSDRCHRASIHR